MLSGNTVIGALGGVLGDGGTVRRVQVIRDTVVVGILQQHATSVVLELQEVID